jgi:hypothetical protein
MGSAANVLTETFGSALRIRHGTVLLQVGLRAYPKFPLGQAIPAVTGSADRHFASFEERWS